MTDTSDPKPSLGVLGARPEEPGAAMQRLRMQSVIARVLGPQAEKPRIGRYVVEAKVGAGGMGVIFRALDPDNGQSVAIKLLNRANELERPRLRREGEVLRSIVHPNVVRYLDHGTTEDGLDFLVMDWLVGVDLSTRLKQGALGVEETLRFGLAAARALLAAHAAGVVHRDVKPSNFFLVGGSLDELRLIDFGVARPSSETDSAKLTATGAMVGSPMYMAPEQLRGEHDVRTDVYGLGATLFECMTGRAPFVGSHPVAILLAVVAEPVPSASALCPHIPSTVDRLLGRMLSKRSTDRPPHMNAVIAELSDLLAQSRFTAADAALDPRDQRFRNEREARVVKPAKGDASVDALIGRARELALVEGVLRECRDDSLAAVVVVSAGAGYGKTALLHELERRCTTDAANLVSLCRCDEAHVGTPFSALQALLTTPVWLSRGACGVEHRQMLGLLEQVRGGPGMKGHYSDPLVLADQLRLAWMDLIDACIEQGPIVWFLDDAQHADLASLRFIDRALSRAQGRCLTVVLSSRGSSGIVLGQGLDAARIVAVPLGPLRPQSALTLAARYIQTSDEVLRNLVELAAGHPGHLVELCKAQKQGQSVHAATMAELVWKRLHALSPHLRRILRVASIVGRHVWVSAIAALIDVRSDDPELLQALEQLANEGFLERRTLTERADPELDFASELMRLAAYELCTEEDLSIGHSVMARWLMLRADQGAVEIAHHHQKAGEHTLALPLFLAAARAALVGDLADDLESLLRQAELSLEKAGLSRPEAQKSRAEIAELKAQSSFWRGSLTEAQAQAAAGLACLPKSSDAWFRLSSLAITSAGQQGDNSAVASIASEVLRHTSSATSGDDARTTALCRALTQLAAADHPFANELWRAIEAGPEPHSPDASAWRYRAYGTLVAKQSFDAIIDSCVQAHRLYVEARDHRSAAQIGFFLGTLQFWCGAWEAARASTLDALRIVDRLDAPYLRLWGRYTLAKTQTELATPAEAAALLDAIVDQSVHSPRIRAGALVYGAIASETAGRSDDAVRKAKLVLAEASVPLVKRGAAAALCRSLLSQGCVIEALPLAELLVPLPIAGTIAEFDELVMLARTELCLAQGDEVGAREACVDAVAAIHQRASTLQDPLRRNAYLARPMAVARTFMLSERFR